MFTLEETAKLSISLMDLTSLNDDDDRERIAALCRQAHTPAGDTAALCIWPRFIPFARRELRELGTPEIRLATVTNFPLGEADVELAAAETAAAVAYGSDEVDLVFPWRALREGDAETGRRMVERCRELCDGISLKVIIESGELQEEELIRICIEAGADFVKTSTGKVPVNATPEAARIILETIKASGRDVGFKAAGGVRTAEDARVYLELAAEIMGRDWITPQHFRFGASSLLNSLLGTLGYEGGEASTGSY